MGSGLDDPIDVGLAIGTSVGVLLCCVCTIVCTYIGNRRYHRPRDDSTDSLV